jgi:uncharacterized protein YbdZ (MbtH family)
VIPLPCAPAAADAARSARRRVVSAARLFTLALTLVMLSSAGCSSEGLAVKIKGNQFVDGQGKPVRMLGVNRSGPEYACIQGHGLVDGPLDAASIAAMTRWRINAVRVPLNEHCWLGINGAPPATSGAPYRAAITAYVELLHKAGLIAVLDMHWNAPAGSLATGQQAMADLDHAPAFWSSVAQTFKDDPAVIFDLYNEPQAITWECWRDGCTLPDGWRAVGMQRLVDVVREQGARQPIVVTGTFWGSDLSKWLAYRPRDPAKQLAAGFHVFDFSGCNAPDCWQREVARVARVVPVATTEFGERACTGRFLTRYMRWADTAGVSYLAWAWNPNGCAAPSLISDWRGHPTRSGVKLREHLAALSLRG